MSYLHAHNSMMTVLLLSSIVVALITTNRRSPQIEMSPSTLKDAPYWIGMSLFLVIWLVFVPVNFWAALTHHTESWIFGSERFDGGVVETLTVVFYLLAIFQTVRLVRDAKTLFGDQSALLWRAIFAIGLLGFVFMIGEEISWGQHWFGFKTPDELDTLNLQHEANVHNLVSPRLYDAIYQVLGWSLILAPVVARWSFPRDSKFSMIEFLKGCYRWPWTYVLLASSGILLQHEVFEELSEMVLAIAVFHTLFTFSRHQRCPVS